MPIRRNTTYSSRATHAARAAHARGDKKFRTYDTSYIQPRKSKAPVIVAVIIAILVVIGAAFLITTNVKGCSGTSSQLAEGTSVEFTVNAGDGGGAVADNLAKAGLVSSASDFKNRLSARGADQALKPGTYTIVAGTSIDDIISQLTNGPTTTGISFVVPEGTTLTTIAGNLAYVTNGRISNDQFMAAATVSNYQASYSFLNGASSLEGFLFPKTYSVTDDDTADSMIRKMLDQYQTETSVLNYSYPQSKGLSNYQVLILASIVEKEADENTRAKVAAVFYNRLLNMGDPSYGYLQSDATTAYEVGHDPTSEEVHADTPYSTYTHQGLPPTPICNPGIEALQAVCNPDQSTINDGYYFFYFAKDASGQMQYYFSKTLDEHNAVIAAHS